MGTVPDNFLDMGVEKKENYRIILWFWPYCLEKSLTEIEESLKAELPFNIKHFQNRAKISVIGFKI